jgi:WAS family protein
MDSAGNLAINIPNELECVTNGTLANIIRQLSSLSRFAEDLFGSILSEASLLMVRSTNLQTRIDRLSHKVVSLDSSVEEVSLQDIHLRKAFKSGAQFDQQVVSRDSIPDAIERVYAKCDRPPALNKLNQYRDDGKDGLKFYTDPNYFFELWRQEMLADTEKALAGRKVPKAKLQEHKKARKVRQPMNTRERYRQMMANQGEFIIDQKNGLNLVYLDTNGQHFDPQDVNRPQSLELPHNFYIENNHVMDGQRHFQSALPAQPVQQQAPPPPLNHNQYNHNLQQQYEHDVQAMNQYNASAHHIYGPGTRRQVSSASRPSQPPPAPPSGPPTPQHSAPEATTPSRSRARETLPPPPPPPQEMNGRQEVEERAEPPPPPPPPPAGYTAVVPDDTQQQQRRQQPTVSDLKSIQLKKASAHAQQPRPTDARSDLLAAIREGIKLKRVEDCKQREVEKSTPLHDVASILARRVAIELSDSEGGAEDDDDSDAWDDESEC